MCGRMGGDKELYLQFTDLQSRESRQREVRGGGEERRSEGEEKDTQVNTQVSKNTHKALEVIDHRVVHKQEKCWEKQDKSEIPFSKGTVVLYSIRTVFITVIILTLQCLWENWDRHGIQVQHWST